MYEDIFAKIRYEAEKRNLKESTINAYCNSVDYFLRTVNKDISDLTLKMNWDDEDIPRMKLDHSLPVVLSRDEIQSIIDHTPNLKHKAMIATMYSSGLRVSEVVHLHYDDISRTNKTVYVRESKSRRDRYTILSDKNLDLLTEYWFQCGKPRGILFPSSCTGTYLRENGILQTLPAPLREAADLRTEHSGASLTELGELAKPPVGRSGMNHRLRKLSALAQKAREEKNPS